LMYHAVGTAIDGDTRGLYNMGVVQFKRHVKYLASHYRQGLVPLSLEPVQDQALRIVLTFDDGYLDNLKVAAPLLVELGIPFTVFVCTDAVAQRKSGFLEPDDVRELASLPGVQIGSHSASHARLTRCDDLQLHQELAGSKSYLEDLIGGQVCTLSYPHGDVDRRVRDVAEKVGYVIGCTSRFDINAESRDPLLLCRTDIWAEDTVSVFEEKLQGDWDWNRWRMADPASAF
jgi:peptidoglycan/xylan/chitin deacetylase (PgdA/CDA1 family)